MELIERDKIVEELNSLYDNISECISDLIVARCKRDEKRISDANYQMESLLVETKQTIAYILQNII